MELRSEAVWDAATVHVCRGHYERRRKKILNTVCINFTLKQWMSVTRLWGDVCAEDAGVAKKFSATFEPREALDRRGGIAGAG